MRKNNQVKSSRRAIEWRRDFVLTKLSQGYSQSDIAAELKLHSSTISLDCKFLSEQSRQNMKEHIEERIPMRHAVCDVGLNAVLRKAWEISNDPNSKKSEILQSLSLISDTYGKLMTLATDEKTISQAISWIEKQKESLNLTQEQQQEEQPQSDTDTVEEAQEEKLEQESE